MENFCTFYHLNCIRAKENYTSYIARMQKQSAASSLISRNEGNLVKFNLLNVSFPLNFLHLSLSLLPVSNAKFAFFSQVCVAAIAQTECILALKKCMENERDLVAMCCETLTRLFKCQHVSGLFFKRF